MTTYEEFRDDLHDALNHLHNPDHDPSPLVRLVVTGDPESDLPAVQNSILQAIDELAPAADTPESARIRRLHNLLDYRFVQDLKQEDTAERLKLAVRTVRREEQTATHVLARSLWERHVQQAAGSGTEPRASSGSGPEDWQANVREEIDALWSREPEVVADVAQVIERVIALDGALAARYGKTLSSEPSPERLTVAVPATALRTLLVMALGQLCRLERSGHIVISAAGLGGQTVITLRGPGGDASPDVGRLAAMINVLGGTLRADSDPSATVLNLMLPTRPPITVAVVDDNQDFIRFCQRCFRGTSFTAVTPETYTLADIAKLDPDVVLLDIMLPRTDGWELLEALREDARTADVPVVICSVVPEEDLAMLMGAAAYLPKPIQHQELIGILGDLLD